MTTPSNEQSLEGLIERVKAATGPMTGNDVEACIRLAPWYADTPSHDPIWSEFVRALQGSIDAALALVERLLPDWVVADLSQNSRHAGDPWGCTLAFYVGSNPSKNRSVSSGYDFPEPSLAILAALFTALKDASE